MSYPFQPERDPDGTPVRKAHQHVFRAVCLFGGGGGMALGTQQAQQCFREHLGRFELGGAYDFDRYACQVYEYLTGCPEAQRDATTITVENIHEIFGVEPPDAAWCSAPCKGSSKLLSSAKAATEKYVAMNDLSYRGILTLLDAYPDDPIGLLIFENVPNITTRAKQMLTALRALLRSRGYVIHDGFHEARHIGDLAQRRKRWFMVARHPNKVPVFLYKPPHKAGKVCGDVLGPLPLPNDPAGGPMHRLSDTSMINLLRLWKIPAGGDWRDLIPDGRPRRERFRRQHIAKWTEPSVTVGGSGSNGPCAVADPREPTAAVELARESAFKHVDRVTKFDQVIGTITAAGSQSNGAACVADPRIDLARGAGPEDSRRARDHVDRVTGFDQPPGTITAARSSSSGAPSVADRRVPVDLARTCPGFTSMDHVLCWTGPSRTVTGANRPGNGSPSIADPRPIPLIEGEVPSAEERRRWEREGKKTAGQTSWFNGKFKVTEWVKPTGTVIGAGAGNGGGYVADPRVDLSLPDGTFNHVDAVTSWDAATGTVTHSPAPSSGAPAVADPRVPAPVSLAPPSTRGAGPYDVFSKHCVTPWNGPSRAVIGGEGNGASAVADPRLPLLDERAAWHDGVLGVVAPEDVAPTVTSAGRPTNGSFSYAGPVPLEPQAGNPGKHWGKYVVRPWTEAANTVTGASRVGSGAPSAADPRVDLMRPTAKADGSFHEGAGPGRWGVLSPLDPATTVTRNARLGTGPFSIAAAAPEPVNLIPKAGVNPNHAGLYGVLSPDQPSRTITATSEVGCGANAIAAPVPQPIDLVPAEACYDAAYGVLSPGQPSRTIAANAAAGCGAYAIADKVPSPSAAAGTTVADDGPVQLGLGCDAYNGAYGVTPFGEAASAVVAHGQIDNSRVAVADPRPAPPPYVVLSCAETERIVSGEVPVPFAIVDPDHPEEPLAIVDDLKRPPFRWVETRSKGRGKNAKEKITRRRETVALVLISADGTWHRPLTTLELAILQAFPPMVRGKPLDFGGGTTAQREVIGNAVPPAVARAMADQMLLCLIVASTLGFALGEAGSAVWVKNVRALERQLRREGYVVVKRRRPMNFTTGEVLDDGHPVWRKQKVKSKGARKKPRRAASRAWAPAPMGAVA